MKCTSMVYDRRMNTMVNVELLEDAGSLKYSGSHVAVDGGIDAEVKCRINEVVKVWRGMKSVRIYITWIECKNKIV